MPCEQHGGDVSKEKGNATWSFFPPIYQGLLVRFVHNALKERGSDHVGLEDKLTNLVLSEAWE